jgi:hypothetical protein
MDPSFKGCGNLMLSQCQVCFTLIEPVHSDSASRQFQSQNPFIRPCCVQNSY